MDDTNIDVIARDYCATPYTSSLTKNLLLKLGFRPHNLGTQYLSEALLLIKDNSLADRINLSAEIYPKIALKSNTSLHNVQKAISFAVKNANIDEGLCGRMEMLLGIHTAQANYPPTPKELISALKTYISSVLLTQTKA